MKKTASPFPFSHKIQTKTEIALIRATLISKRLAKLGSGIMNGG
jgi:hypothetical protein